MAYDDAITPTGSIRRTTATVVAAALATLIVPVEGADAQEECPSGEVALTFDDGPGEDTPEVLDVLAAYEAPATFFVLGRNVEELPQVTARAVDEGHAVANHTYAHERLTELTDPEIEATVLAADEAIEDAGIEPTTLLRPPYGATDDRVRSAIASAGYDEKTWTIDPRDWEPDRTPEQIRDHVLANLHDGAVVLLHDWTAPEVGEADASNTIAALPDIVEGARSQGYCFGYLDDSGDIVVPTDRAAGDLPATAAERTWSLRGSLSSGDADVTFTYGRSGDERLLCDWNGDGSRTPGIVRDGEWHLRNSRSGGAADVQFHYGRAGDVPVCGDWNGDGVETIGVRRGGEWHLRDANSGGPADHRFHYGRAGDVPVVGDWDGDGQANVGVVREREWLLRESHSGGAADVSFTYGRSGDVPVVGDWDGSGQDAPGIVRESTWHLRDSLRGGTADVEFTFDAPGDTPLSWR